MANGWAQPNPPRPPAPAQDLRTSRSRWPVIVQGVVLLLAILALVWLAKVAFDYEGSFLGSATGLPQGAWLVLCLAILLVLLGAQIALFLMLRRSLAAPASGWGDAAQPAADPVAKAWDQAAPAQAAPEPPFEPEPPAPVPPAAEDWGGGQTMLLRCKACGNTFQHTVRPGRNDVFSCPHCSRPGHYVGR